MSMGLRKRYRLLTDGEAHYYVVPDAREDEFLAICDKITAYWDTPGVLLDDSVPPDIPAWAHRVGGASSRVTFERPEVDGEPVE